MNTLAEAVEVIDDELARLTAERDRSRELAARLEGICAERERLLWLAIEATTPVEQTIAGRQIARHLRETAFIPGMESSC